MPVRPARAPSHYIAYPSILPPTVTLRHARANIRSNDQTGTDSSSDGNHGDMPGLQPSREIMVDMRKLPILNAGGVVRCALLRVAGIDIRGTHFASVGVVDVDLSKLSHTARVASTVLLLLLANEAQRVGRGHLIVAPGQTF